MSSRGSRSIHVGVKPDAVWAALVGPGRREWYYRLQPEGEFQPGARIRWVDLEGKAAEESEVVEVAPRRLVLRTRFVFAPGLAAAPQHLVEWELAGDEGGTQVRMSWEADGPAGRMLESEAQAQLQGLRLAVDPAARAELERLREIGPIEIRDVGSGLLPAYQHFFDDIAFRDFPEWQSCYCMETHRTQGDDEWAERTAADNRHDMSESIRRGEVTALLAFDGDEPVGWCNYGETARLAGVMHRFGLAAANHPGVGSVACFVIAPRYRGHGVASKLLDAAIERLRVRGLRAVEAYPARSDDSEHTNYRGPLSMFVRAGFEFVREIGRHVIVRKNLA